MNQHPKCLISGPLPSLISYVSSVILFIALASGTFFPPPLPSYPSSLLHHLQHVSRLIFLSATKYTGSEEKKAGVYTRVVGKSSFVQINLMSCFQRSGSASSLLDSKLFQNKPIYLLRVEISTGHCRNKAGKFKCCKRNS